MSYVYRNGSGGDRHLRTVGFYDPDGGWHAESDHATDEAAAARCNWLNGGTGRTPQQVEQQRQLDECHRLGVYPELAGM